MATLTPTPGYTPQQPPAYVRADATPAYELDDLSASRQTSLHPLQIEACAPKPAPRELVPRTFKHVLKMRPSRKVKIWMGVGLVCVCALVGALVWWGVDKKRKDGMHASLELAQGIERPQVPSSPDSSTGGSLVTPLSFSSPTSTVESLKFDQQKEANYTIYKSSAQTLRLPATDSTFVKLFGESSCGVVFKVGSNQSETDILVGVDAQWRQRAGDDDATSRAWGIAEANAVQGGMYLSEGNRSAGLMLLTSATTWKRTGSKPTLWQGTVDDVYAWDQAVIYKVLVVYPPSFTPSDSNRALNMWAMPRTDVLFDNHGNLTFASIDVRLPQGSVASYGYEAKDEEHYNGVRSDSLSISVGRGMSGRFSPGTNVTRLALDGPPSDHWTNADIRTQLTFHEPRTRANPSLSTPISARFVASGSVNLNITSLPLTSSLELQAVSSNSTVRAYFLTLPAFRAYEGEVEYHLAADASGFEDRSSSRSYTQLDKPSYVPGEGEEKVTYGTQKGRGKKVLDGSAKWGDGDGNGGGKKVKVRLDAKRGATTLAFGSRDQRFY